jgi:hypothetical protein
MVYWDTDPSAELQEKALAATNLALDIDDQNAVFLYFESARATIAWRIQ